MRRYALSSVVGLLLLLAAQSAPAQVSFSFSFGAPPTPPRVYRVPARPGPEFLWVEGYWATPRGHYDHDHRWDRDRGRDYQREWREHHNHDDRR